MRSICTLLAVILATTACQTTQDADQQEERINSAGSQAAAASERAEASMERFDGLEARISALEAALGSLNVPSDTSSDLADLEREVAALGSELRDLRFAADDAYNNAYSAASDLVYDLSECINTYMDTIAWWSSNVGSSSQHYYC